MILRSRVIFIVSVILIFSGCDGIYHLIHVSDEGNGKSSKPQHFIYCNPDSTLYVEISGGCIQEPLTKKVKAAGLYIYMNSQCQDSCEYVFSRTSILSGSHAIYPDDISVNYFSLNSSKKENLIEYDGKEKSYFKEVSFLIGPGRMEVFFSYSSFYDSLGYLHFPIKADIGYIVHGSDTVSLNDIDFSAVRGYARN
ncbi:MAG: hypothetical protein KAR42_01955 [candidate division Zixibacteria bacterium]|nr:hypothetical protein [candidate division Zixibacteria bacterium]